VSDVSIPHSLEPFMEAIALPLATCIFVYVFYVLAFKKPVHPPTFLVASAMAVTIVAGIVLATGWL
jgi:hypothetical protein